MENASKALIIAGSVLIGVVILSMLVVFFNNIKNVERTKQSNIKTQQDIEFNRSYEAYNRDVYGSELLSIANKIEDYNLKEGNQGTKAYTKIELDVYLSQNLDDEFLTEGKHYSSNDIVIAIKEIEDEVKFTGNITISFKNNAINNSRRISKLAGMRTKEIEDLGTLVGISKEEYNRLINPYNTYKSLLTQIKSKVFKIDGFEYDENTKRVIKMKYKL